MMDRQQQANDRVDKLLERLPGLLDVQLGIKEQNRDLSPVPPLASIPGWGGDKEQQVSSRRQRSIEKRGGF